MSLLIEIIGWLATIFRSWGMLCKSPNMIKYLVSGGNFLWMCSGILTSNIPLITSNAICLVIMLFEIVKNNIKKTSEK